MLWKERYFARTDFFTKLVVLPATIFLTVCVILGGGFDETVGRSLLDVWNNGYRGGSSAAAALHETLTEISPIYISLWLLAVAGTSASTVTHEREQNTWDGLTASPLSAAEILRGKALGAVWGLRGFGALLSLFWLVGLATSAIHPLGLLLGLAVAAMLTWFVVSLGIHLSLVARTTTRAVTLTIVTLVFLNIGYVTLLYPLLWAFGVTDSSEYWWGSLPEVACTPFLPAFALLSYAQVANIPGVIRGAGPRNEVDLRVVSCAIAVLAVYTIAAATLAWWSRRRFDRVVDRPRRVSADKSAASPPLAR
jgi:ABC-type Na+ efflux pump permease subunit